MSNSERKLPFIPADFSEVDGWLYPAPSQGPQIRPSSDGSYLLKVFRSGGAWTFKTPSDVYPGLPDRDLGDNALVGGMDLLLDRLAQTQDELILWLADRPPLESERVRNLVHLKWISGDRTNEKGWGNTYEEVKSGSQGWLCSVLFDYYPNWAPSEIWVGVRNPV